MTVKRKIIEIDEELCDGCGNCVPSCAEGALQVLDGKARLVSEVYCDGLGACLGDCPTGALRVVEREAEEFDEEAVEAHLKQAEAGKEGGAPSLACGCPSEQLQQFIPAAAHGEPRAPFSGGPSALTHWPVQIRLVPPTAPFLKGAHLLVAADCTPVAYPSFHRDFLEGKVVLLGCPKFDNVEEYVRKFTDIFRAADIQGVTLVVMEVPCCQGLPFIVEKAMKEAGKRFPVEKVVLSARGQILAREKMAA